MLSVRAFSWLVAGFVALVASVTLAWPELQYVLFAKTTEAQVSQVREVVESRRRSDELMLQVEYMFQDGSTVRHERDRVPMSWSRPSAGTTTPVEYLPSQPQASRLAGHRNLTTPTLLLVALAFFSGFIIPLIRFPRSGSPPPGS